MRNNIIKKFVFILFFLPQVIYSMMVRLCRVSGGNDCSIRVTEAIENKFSFIVRNLNVPRTLFKTIWQMFIVVDVIFPILLFFISLLFPMNLLCYSSMVPGNPLNDAAMMYKNFTQSKVKCMST